MKRKIVCTHHSKHKPFLIVYEERPGNRPDAFWIKCQKCRAWFKLVFNAAGGPTLTELPIDYHLDLVKTPVLVKGGE